MCNAIGKIQLTSNTVTRRVGCMSDATEELTLNFEICKVFSLQLDRSTDICDLPQFLAFTRKIFNYRIIKDGNGESHKLAL